MAADQKIQIYSNPTDVIRPFWKDKYEREAKKYWDIFYKRHENRFFKDRHYLDKEWGQYFSLLSEDHSNSMDTPFTDEVATEKKVVLEVGCGAGNTIFPLLSTFPYLFVYACDFSPRAINLVKAHKDYKEDRMHAFLCDLTVDDLTSEVSPSSVDIITMIFVLSAVSPDKMPQVLQNIRRVLKPDGHVLLRDYAIGDLAQERLTSKDQKISENFYVRGDGTRVFYFSEEALTSLFTNNGFVSKKVGIHYKKVENRSRELVMDRRWIQGVFYSAAGLTALQSVAPKHGEEYVDCKSTSDNEREPQFACNSLEVTEDKTEVDLSESIVVEMLGGIPVVDEVIDILVGDHTFNLKCLSREYQHTCKSTGFMIWESARMLSGLLAANLNIVCGKTVLELGCGSAGICSMVAAKAADLVVATDGDPQVLSLLNENMKSNIQHFTPGKMICERLEWGNKEHICAIKSLSAQGYDVIIGTDVTYIAEAIIPFFETARALISTRKIGKPNSALILCHVIRRVDEGYIISVASQCGFHLEDKWPSNADENLQKLGRFTKNRESLIGSWFHEDAQKIPFLQNVLRIMYFHS